jgi:hypothetical protein
METLLNEFLVRYKHEGTRHSLMFGWGLIGLFIYALARYMRARRRRQQRPRLYALQ